MGSAAASGALRENRKWKLEIRKVRMENILSGKCKGPRGRSFFICEQDLYFLKEILGWGAELGFAR
jgi:hypothetical protein